jgi:GT2 family glycosyltransferase
MNNKVGVAIITCDRQPFFEKCLYSLYPTAKKHEKIDTLIVVNDGAPYPKSIYTSVVDEVIQNSRNLGVACSKNKALRALIAKGCNHLFLIEDDIIIKNSNVFEQYIKSAATSGIWHLNYGLHGSYNRDERGDAVVKNLIEYAPSVEVAFYHNILGAFSYYLASIIKHVGYMDERYRNAFEHVDHTYRIIKKELHPPFWYFADIANSWDYIEDQTENYEGSKIRNEKEFADNFQNAMAWFQHKHGTVPQHVPETPPEKTLEVLDEIQKNYSKAL